MKDQIRNTKIKEEINIFILTNEILKFRSHWKHHVLHMEDEQIPKKILTYNPIRRRITGCPQLI
jgi:hypothetical protein